MSPLAVLVSTLAWATLWGPIGLLLAVPLTVCLIVVGRHVPQLSFLGVLLGDAPALPVEAQIYHRLLARSPFDAVEIAVEVARKDGVAALYDNVLLPVLVLAENDRKRATLGDERQRLVVDGFEEIIAAVADEADTVADEGADGGAEDAEKSGPGNEAEAGGQNEAPVMLCVGGRSELDHGAALVAADVLRRRNVAADAIPLAATGDALKARDDGRGVCGIVLCLVQPGSAPVIQHLLRRIRRLATPEPSVAIGAFGASAVPEAGVSPLANLGPVPVGRTFADIGEIAADMLEHSGEARG
jgi:hypothetical protein